MNCGKSREHFLNMIDSRRIVINQIYAHLKWNPSAFFLLVRMRYLDFFLAPKSEMAGKKNWMECPWGPSSGLAWLSSHLSLGPEWKNQSHTHIKNVVFFMLLSVYAKIRRTAQLNSKNICMKEICCKTTEMLSPFFSVFLLPGQHGTK